MGAVRASAPEGFQGFPPEAFAFLSGLEENNARGWFEGHRAVYEQAIVAPALAFVAALGAELAGAVPTLAAEPRLGGSLFRIHRDTRFSTDKRPYKTHVGMRLRDRRFTGGAKCDGPVLYIEFDARTLRLGAGIKAFDRDTLAAWRAVVATPAGAARFRALVEAVPGAEILGEALARVPTGFPPGAGDDLLRSKGLFLMESGALPAAIHGSEFVDHCRLRLAPMTPLFLALREITLLGREGDQGSSHFSE